MGGLVMKSHIYITSCVIAVMLFVGIPRANAMEFHVTTAEEFQAALSSAANNGGDDTILLAAGTYYGNFKYVAEEANALSILPESDAVDGSVILDGQQKAYVILMNGNGFDIVLGIEGLTIRNGMSSYRGGGIYALQPSDTIGAITISGCRVRNSSATMGGGLAIERFLSVELVGNTIAGNSSTEHGGAVSLLSYPYNMVGKIVISRGNRIAGNVAHEAGGGLDITVLGGSATTLHILGNDIDKNTATNHQGGGASIYCSEVPILIEGNIIRGNSSYHAGGGITVGNAANFTLRKNIVDGNLTRTSTSGNEGGGVCYSNQHHVSTDTVIASNTVVRNMSPGNGGGIYVGGSSATLTNNTIAWNQAQKGGGIYILTRPIDTMRSYNSIYWGNSVSSIGEGKDIYLEGYAKESSSFNSIYADAFAIWDSESRNLGVDPLFYDPGKGDFHLRMGSPALDSGHNAAPNMPETDLDGNPRIMKLPTASGWGI